MNTQKITLNQEPLKLVYNIEHVEVKETSPIWKIKLLCRKSLVLRKLFGAPVLPPGLASLVLRDSELKILDGHYISTLRNLLKLFDTTPRSFIYLLAGSLPASAILHPRQLTLFLMICHLQGDPLHSHTEYMLPCSESCKKSWFLHG